MTKIRPLGNRVLVKRSQPQTMKGGILLPETAKEKPKERIVIATGPGELDDNGVRIPMNVKEGDRILFSTYSGTEVKSHSQDSNGDEDYLILSENDILGILV